MATSALQGLREYNLAPFWDPETGQEHTWKRWLTVLDYGWGWYQEYKAQETFLNLLRPLLDRRFIVIRNYVWPELEYPFPLILIGPPGVYLLYVTPLSGEFRIHENRLLQLGTGKGKGQPVKPNLVHRTKLLGEVLQKFIAERLDLEVPVESRLVFVAPDVYVDTVDAEIKPLLPDGVKGFAESLLKARERLNRLQIRRLAELFLEGESQQDKTAAQAAKERRTQILAAAQQTLRQEGATAAGGQRPRAQRTTQSTTDRIFGLTLKQWLVLAGLLALNIVLLLVFIFLVATSG